MSRRHLPFHARFAVLWLGIFAAGSSPTLANAAAPPNAGRASVHFDAPPAATAHAQYDGPRDTLGHWSSRFGLPYFDGVVRAMVVHQGQPAVCGHFQHADGRPAGAVLRWNGSAWEDLGSVYGNVLALAVHQGELIAAGSFVASGGQTYGVVARWTGSAWERIGRDSTWGTVWALASHDSLLAIGGELVGRAGADTIRNVALWNGHAWSGVGGGIVPHVRALEFHDGALHAAGLVSPHGSGTVATVERWDGAAWHLVGDSLRGAYGWASLEAMTTFGGDLVVGGYFSQAGDESVPSIARFRNGRWEWPYAAPTLSIVDLEVSEGSLWIASAAGPAPAGLEVFDGATLSAAPDWEYESPSVLAAAGNELYVATWTMLRAHTVLRRDPGGWTELQAWDAERSHGLTSSPACAVGFDGELVVAGRNLGAGNGGALEDVGAVASWDGTRWRALGDTRSWTVEALIVHQGRLVAGGSFVDTERPELRHLAVWDGTRWQPIAGGPDLPVTALASDGDRLVVGGWFTSVGNLPARHVAAWDGAEWTAMSLDVPSSASVRALAVHDGRVHVGGNFETSDGIHHLAAWDGDSWHAVGSGESPGVLALASFRGELIVGAAASVESSRPLRAWNGRSWRELDVGGWEVAALEVWGNELVVGGYLFRGGPWTPGANLFAYDGSDWRTFRRGLQRPVRTLVADGDRLWVGGEFTQADGLPAFHLAQWTQTSPMPSPRPSRLALRVAGPNPFASAVGIDFGLPIRGRARLKIYDVTGRELAVLVDGVREAGTYRVSWDGRDHAGRRVPPGVYLARLEAERTTVTRRIVHVP